MRKYLSVSAAVAAVAVAGVIGCNLRARASSPDGAVKVASAAPPPEDTGGGGVASLTPVPSLAPLVKKLRPSVVNIYTTQNVHPRRRSRLQQEPGERGGMEDFFNHFFGGEMPQQEQKRQALGSGFILGDGLVLTNNHVIEGADVIKVKLADGREFDAKIVGRDESTDVGLLKLGGDAATTTQAVKLGDSDLAEVGDYVVAIGNPFGLSLTVTAGIVSAKERVIGAGPYDDFIQTDASINPGNSGGPLFNLRGEVIGINTAIVAQGQGIGFAVPIDLAKDVIPQLREKGKVTRGWLGVGIQEITPDLAHTFGIEAGKGALISQVFPKGPAAKAGIKSGDVVTAYNGKPIDSPGALSRNVAATPPGKDANLTVLRDGKTVNITVRMTERNEANVKNGNMSGEDNEGGESGGDETTSATVGLSVGPISPAIAERLGIDANEGVLVTNVEEGSAAEAAGVQPNDVLLELQRRPVASPSAYQKIARTVKPGDTVLFRVRRGGGALFLAAKAPGKK
jgi:serine protease Do